MEPYQHTPLVRPESPSLCIAQGLRRENERTRGWPQDTDSLTQSRCTACYQRCSRTLLHQTRRTLNLERGALRRSNPGLRTHPDARDVGVGVQQAALQAALNDGAQPLLQHRAEQVHAQLGALRDVSDMQCARLLQQAACTGQYGTSCGRNQYAAGAGPRRVCSMVPCRRAARPGCRN